MAEKENKVEAKEETEKKVSSPKPKASSKKKEFVARPVVMNFDKWVKQAGVKPSHVPGMRAFVKNPNRLRTKASWDKLFENY